MRAALAALILSAATAAQAQPGPAASNGVPIVVAPFSSRCFDAARLAERVRGSVGDLPVTVHDLPVTVRDLPVTVHDLPSGSERSGDVTQGSRNEVRVRVRGSELLVEVLARDAAGVAVSSARRVIPADGDCATTLDVTALIVARAALPLNWQRSEPRPPTRPGPHRPRPARSSSETASAPTSAPAAGAPAAGQAAAPPAAPPQPLAPQPPGAPAATPAPAAAPPAIVKIVRAPVEPGTIVLRTHGPDRRWVGELSLGAYGSFGLGRAIDSAGGELAVGFRHGRFGAAARATLDDDWHAQLISSAGTIGVTARRSAVALEAHVDLPLRVGALRFAAGPTLPIYIVRPSGVPHPQTSLLPAFEATLRILYHLDLGRLYLSGGVACDVAFAREDLTVSGAGVVTRTPWVRLGPLVALGANL